MTSKPIETLPRISSTDRVLMLMRVRDWIERNDARLEAQEWRGDLFLPGLAAGVYLASIQVNPCSDACEADFCPRHIRYVKIGHATSMVRRFAALQAGHPFTMHIVAMFAGSVEDARELQTMLDPAHLRRNWYRLCEPIQELQGVLIDYGGFYDREDIFR